MGAIAPKDFEKCKIVPFDSLWPVLKILVPKLKARHLASAGAILFQFKKFQNLVHDPPFF